MASIESEASSFKSPTRQLTDENSSEWLIDIKAHLRSKKLWEHTQNGPDPEESASLQAKWLHPATDES